MTDPVASSLRTLPEVPAGVRTLTTEQARILNDRLPSARVTMENCITCRGAKTFRWYALGTDEVVEYACDCVGQYKSHRYLLHAGVMLNYQRLGWRDFIDLPEDVAAAALDYVDNSAAYVDAGVGLVLSGTRGNGKTLLAHLIVKELLGRGVTCYATSFSDMIDEFADGWRDRAQSQWFNAAVRNAGVLMIDDLGRERNKGPNSVGDNMLETVVRHRTGCQQPTIITTNLSPEQINTGYGGHTMSLLTERSIICQITGPDQRKAISDRVLAEVRLGITRPVVWA